MRKKQSQKGDKKQVKGVRYIAERLRKYQKRKYPTYKIALEESRNVLSKIQSKNENVTLKNIFAITRDKKKVRKQKEKVPYVPQFMLEPNPYFSLLEYDYWVKRCSNKVFFESTLSPSTLEDIQGGTNIDADEYFSDFVRFCNILKSETDPEEDRYISEWQVICTQPQKINGRWVSTIVCVNEFGDQTNYGFDPDRPSAEPPPPVPVTKPVPKPKKKKEEPTKKPKENAKPKKAVAKAPEKPKKAAKADAERVQEIRNIIADLREDAKAGLISKEDYSKKVDALLKKLEKGGNV